MSTEASIPQELKTLPQWVVWQEDTREDGKPTKVPYRPLKPRQKAKTDNATTWGTFEQALSMSQTNGFGGVGFVFSKDDPYCGIDLDKCRDPETGEIEPWAKDIIDELSSYTEVSPSGQGLHVLVKGKLPPGGRRNGKLEMYDSGRFFTVTGQRLENTSTTIEDRQEALEKLHSKMPHSGGKQTNVAPIKEGSSPLTSNDICLLARLMEGPQGRKFKDLWDGNPQGDKSHSEHDFAWCSRLARSVGKDAARIDRLFRHSGLMREKWDEVHSAEGATYGQMTISKTLEGIADNPGYANYTSQGGVKIMSAEELLSQPWEGLPEVIGSGVLPEGGALILAGPAGVGKSTLGLEMAVRLSQGLEIWGLPVPQSCKVLLVQAEMPGPAMVARLQGILSGLDLSNTPSNLFICNQGLDLSQDLASLIKAVEEYRAEMVVLDPLSSYHSLDENSNSEMRPFLDRLKQSLPHTALIIVHHHGKGWENSSSYRGASSIKDWCDTLVNVREKGEKLEMQFEKVRHGPRLPDIILKRKDFLHIPQFDGAWLARMALQALGGKAQSQSELIKVIRKQADRSEKTAKDWIHRAVVTGLIREETSPGHRQKKTYSL